MGEGFENDEILIPYISSASIACGYHAGSERIMRTTIRLCKKHGVAAGAHPSFPDRENFGRTDMHLPTGEIYDLMIKQLMVLEKIAGEEDVPLHHVKPHGALYNMAAKDKELASAITRAVKDFNKELIVYGLSGSLLVKEAQKAGLRAWHEVFADRTYNPDGSLTSRKTPGALLENPGEVADQVLQMINQGTVTATDGTEIEIKADTACIHGDGIHAAEFARVIHNTLTEHRIGFKRQS